MKYDSKALKKITSPSKPRRSENAGSVMDMMTDARYLRQSSALINEALQKGFDVLQLADGGIVTTGTKTVVYHYKWEPEKGKLVKTKSESTKKPAPRIMVEEDEDESESEEA